MAKEQVEHGIRLRQELETRRHAEEKEKDMQMRWEDDEVDLEAMQVCLFVEMFVIKFIQIKYK